MNASFSVSSFHLITRDAILANSRYQAFSQAGSSPESLNARSNPVSNFAFSNSLDLLLLQIAWARVGQRHALRVGFSRRSSPTSSVT
jgi:hypothetical protein